MILHPLLIAVLVADLTGLLLLLAAALTALRINIRWAPQSATSQQIGLERAAESAALTARFALTVNFFSTLVLILGITNVLPGIIPGAMCGTGVLQATGNPGAHALFFRFLVFVILYNWRILEKLNTDRPDRPLAQGNARVLLLVLPVYLLALSNTFQAIFLIDVHQPVDCCAIVYGRSGDLSNVRQTGGMPDTLWLLTFWISSILLALCGFRTWRTKQFSRRKTTGWLAVLALFWAPIAAVALVRIFAAYYYQVLHHHCPWCLFLSDHQFVGIPLFTTLAVVALEGPASFIAARTACNYPELVQTATLRSRIAALRILLAVIAFIGMVALPAIFWRLQFGVWIR